MTIKATAGNKGSDYTHIVPILGDDETDRLSITATKTVVRAADHGVDIIFTGTGFDAGSGAFMGDGTVTGMQIRDSKSQAVILNFTGMEIDGDFLDAAITKAQVSDDPDLLSALLFESDDYSLIGGKGDDKFEGSKFADTLNGGSGNDVLQGKDGSDTLLGGAGTDSLLGNDDNDIINGGAGADFIDGGTHQSGGDTASYAGSNAGVTIDLNAGAATGEGGHAEGDVLLGIERLLGSGFADTLSGDNTLNIIEGGAGADLLDGSGSTDTLSYASSNAAVTITLGAGGAQAIGKGGHAQGDKFSNFESITGSKFNDILTGNETLNTITGEAGNDLIDGGANADKLNGGAGTDTLSYKNSFAGVSVTLVALALGKGGDAEGDVTTDFENFIGSDHADIVSGNSTSKNVIKGGDGADQFFTDFGGGDIFHGEGGNDVVFAGSSFGADTFTGGTGVDLLEYGGSLGGVTVTLGANGTQTVGAGGNAQGDKISGIENVSGSFFDVNKLTGNNLDNIFTSGLADDTLDGGAGNDQLSGGDGNDLLKGGAGDDKLEGGDKNDLLIGGPGKDTLIGDLGLDTASYAGSTKAVSIVLLDNGTKVFGKGDAEGDSFETIENLIGGIAKDQLTGNNLNNVIEGGVGADFLNGAAGTGDTVSYASSNKAVTVSLAAQGTANFGKGGHAAGDTASGFEKILGSAFNDTLSGDSKDNVLDGGKGIDTVDYSAEPNGVFVVLGPNGAALSSQDGFGETDTLINIENVTGSKTGINIIVGNDLVNVLTGGDVDDNLQGDGGVDTLKGGDGDDLLQGGDAADTLIGGDGVDRAVYFNSLGGVTIALGNNGALTFGKGGQAQGDKISSIEGISGSGAADVLTGNNLDNFIEGFSGNDIIKGGAGNDTLQGDNNDDLLIGGAGEDDLFGGSGSDTASYVGTVTAVVIQLEDNGATTNSGSKIGDAAGDTLTSIENLIGGSNSDTLIGNNLANTIEGGAGAIDFLTGNGGTDTLSYASSNKAVIVDLGNKTASGGHAQGDLIADVFENITGSNFADKLTGSGGANVMTGGGGVDALIAGAGADTLIGGLGADTLTGGADPDTFRYDLLAEKGDKIIDFASGIDTIEIVAAGFTNLVVGPATLIEGSAPVAAGTTAQFLYDTDDGRLFYDADGTGAGAKQLLLTLVTAPNISATDIDIV